jgi:hypothetical protein
LIKFIRNVIKQCIVRALIHHGPAARVHQEARVKSFDCTIHTSLDLVDFTRLHHERFSVVIVDPPDEGNLPILPAPGQAVFLFYIEERGAALVVIVRHTDFDVACRVIGDRNVIGHCTRGGEDEKKKKRRSSSSKYCACGMDQVRLINRPINRVQGKAHSQK